MLFKKLLKSAGNYTAIAYNFGVTETAVRKWEIRGVPLKHWRNLIDWYGVTPEDLYAHNEKCAKC